MKENYNWFVNHYNNGMFKHKHNLYVGNLNVYDNDRLDIILKKPIQDVYFLKFIIEFSQHFDYYFTIETKRVEFLDIPF